MRDEGILRMKEGQTSKCTFHMSKEDKYHNGD